jgi:hypothetical protein
MYFFFVCIVILCAYFAVQKFSFFIIMAMLDTIIFDL